MCCHCRQCCCCVADVAVAVVVADVAASWPGQVFAKCFGYMRGSSQLQGRNGFCTLTCSRNLDSCDAYKINKPTLIFICCCQEVDMTLPLPSGLDTYLHTATKWQRQNVDKCQSGKRFVAALRWHLSLRSISVCLVSCSKFACGRISRFGTKDFEYILRLRASEIFFYFSVSVFRFVGCFLSAPLWSIILTGMPQERNLVGRRRRQ